jgi:hypothetical protein
LDEECHDLWVEDGDSVNQTPWVEPMRKKNRISVGTLHTDSKDPEEEIGVPRVKIVQG